MESKCKLCRSNNDLCKSHAIPDSVFRAIFKVGSGQAVIIDDNLSTSIKKTQDSWATNQLCSYCERKINERYENYSLKVLKGEFGFEKRDDGILFEGVKTRVIRDFISAILWRASISCHDNYRSVDLNNKLNETIRFNLNTGSEVPRKLLSVKGYKLIDSTKGGFTKKHLRSIVISPFKREGLDSKNKKFSVICFVFLGYMFEVYLRSVPVNSNYYNEFIGYHESEYLFSFMEVTEINEIFNIMLMAYEKHANGMSTLK